MHLLIDSTGIKVEGEGEWNARKHGGTKRRIWRKIHIGIDAQTLEIRAVELTTSNVGDAHMLPELLDQIPPVQEIASVTSPLTAPSTPESVTMPSPPEVPPRSYRRSRTPSPGSLTPTERSPATKPCERRNASAG